MDNVADHLGRYEIVAKLGQGGMAHVYLALQRGPFASTKLVVIKQLKRDVADEPQFRKMFVDEARIAMRLSHPNVVSTFEFVADPNQFFLTMEFLEGLSLQQVVRRIRRPDLPLDLHLWILARVLTGLQYTHDLCDFDGTRLGIVHRDVSPSNVIITYDGDVKLVDFGIAKSAAASSVTQTGVVKGKLGYVSPEQCLGRPATAASDVYSVGVMLWEAIAGERRVFDNGTADIIQARVRCTEPPIESVRPDTPLALARITRRALAVDPRNRFSSAREFRQELEAYLADRERPVGQDTAAVLMNNWFAAERMSLRKVVEEYVNRDQRIEWDEVTDLGQASLSASGELPSLPSWSADAAVESPPEPPTDRIDVDLVEAAAAASVTGNAQRSSTAAKSRGGRAWLLAGIVCAGGAVAAAPWVHAPLPVGVSPNGREEAAPLPEVVVTSAGLDMPAAVLSASIPPPAKPAPVGIIAPILVVPQPSPVAQALAATPPPSAHEIAIRVAVRPAKVRASVQLDGALLDHKPYVSRVRRDQQTHVVVVSAKGYASVQQAITFDRDQNLDVLLKRGKHRSGVARAAVTRLARRDTGTRDSADAPSLPDDAPMEPTPP